MSAIYLFWEEKPHRIVDAIKYEQILHEMTQRLEKYIKKERESTHKASNETCLWHILIDTKQ
jgi:hypothetical protein